MCEERGFRAPTKRASETGVSHSYQHRHQRQAWNTKAAAVATKNPVCKHRSLSTPPLMGASAAHHCQGPMMQGKLPQENTWHASGCCNITPTSAAADSSRIWYTSLPPAWVSQSPRISCSFNPLLSGGKTDVRGRPTHKGRTKSKVEPQELCKRREREISLCSLRSSRLNLHNQLDVSCICGIPEETMNHPKIEAMDFGNNCRIGVCCMRLTSFWVIWLS